MRTRVPTETEYTMGDLFPEGRGDSSCSSRPTECSQSKSPDDLPLKIMLTFASAARDFVAAGYYRPRYFYPES